MIILQFFLLWYCRNLPDAPAAPWRVVVIVTTDFAPPGAVTTLVTIERTGLGAATTPGGGAPATGGGLAPT